MTDQQQDLADELNKRSDKCIAMDPPVSEQQAKAMHAAAEGRSTLGIPKKVGQEFVGKDAKPVGRWGGRAHKGA